MKKKNQFKISDKKDFVAIRKVISGDRDAFEYIFNKYRTFIYYSILRKVGDVDDASDITAVVLERIYEKMHMYKIDKPFNAWITTIAKNETISYFRRKAKERGTVSLDTRIKFANSSSDDSENVAGVTYDISSDELNAEDTLVQKEQYENLYIAINKLNKQYRWVLKLFYFQNKSYVEIAEQLDISMEVVKTTIFRGKKQLKELLQ